MTTTTHRATAYSHPDFRGVALRFIRYGQTDPDVEYNLTCESDDCPHDTEWCYEAVDVEPEENRDEAIVVMVGDDREHVVDFADLVPLDGDTFCVECGQIGCMHNPNS